MIVLRAKDIAFEVTYIDLREKPEWFLEISPHGKVPVLNVDGRPLFESNAIAEYLDEVVAPRLHPEDAIKRARNRAWTDFVPDFSPALSGVYYTKTPEEMEAALKAHVRQEIGPIAVPAELEFTPTLPKTRSGKIMRRLLKAQELGLDPGDITTLEE